MNELDYRKIFVANALLYKGVKQGDLDHKAIIDTYNSFTPLPRGYKLTYTDPWCAGFVSSIAINCKMTDIIPPECSCVKMVENFQKINRWVEDDNYLPSIGDLVFYDWQDGADYAKTDNQGSPNHVGIVISVSDLGYISVLEGNKGTPSCVGIRVLTRNGRYIRGFALPNFKSLIKEVTGLAECPVLIVKNGSKSGYVKTVQTILNKAIKSSLTIDGIFGKKTENAVKKFQTNKNIVSDGIVGPDTWYHLIKFD